MARKSRQKQQAAILSGTTFQEPERTLSTVTTKYKTGLYSRLSVYNQGRDEGESIENQVKLLQDYVAEHHDLTLTDVYVDNGRTGTNFHRPEFDRLISDVKSGKINCVVVKDLSRFGRNYLETGYYLQKVFPYYQLRFISVNDAYDSLTADPDSIMVAMKNIVNDYYSKDVSRKVSASFDQKKSDGAYVWGHPVYGYIRDKENPVQLLIDHDVAHYVHLMFRWALDGVMVTRIAEYLTLMHAPTYFSLAHQRSGGRTKSKGSTFWTPSVVRQILTSQRYAGDFVGNKSYFRKYDMANAQFCLPEEEWVIIPDQHPAYVSHEDFDQLQKMLNAKRKTISEQQAKGDNHPHRPADVYKGLLFCGLCGKSMTFRWNYQNSAYLSYSCKGSRPSYAATHRVFTMEKGMLETVLFWQIKRQIQLAIDTEAFLKRLSLVDAAERLKAKRQAELQLLHSRIADLSARKLKAFEDLNNGLIDTETYHAMINKIAAGIAAAEAQVPIAIQKRDEIDTYFTMDNKWLTAFLSTGEMPSLSPDLVKKLVKRIDIYPDSRMRITFSFANWMEKLQDYIKELKESEG